MKRLSRAVAFSVVATLVSLLLAPAAAAPPPSAHPVKTEDIEAFLDGLMPQQLGREDIAGAVLFIVTQPRHAAVNEVLVRPTEQER